MQLASMLPLAELGFQGEDIWIVTAVDQRRKASSIIFYAAIKTNYCAWGSLRGWLECLGVIKYGFDDATATAK